MRRRLAVAVLVACPASVVAGDGAVLQISDCILERKSIGGSSFLNSSCPFGGAADMASTISATVELQTALQMQNTALQTQNTTLQSQITTLQTQNTALEL